MAETINTHALHISTELFNIIAELNEVEGAWRALVTLTPERLSALRHIATIKSISSSTRIEGSRLTDQQVENLLSDLTVKRFRSRDEEKEKLLLDGT